MTRYPRLGLPLPLELVNTLFAQSGHLRDALQTPVDLDVWLHANAAQPPRPVPAATATELQRVRALRYALRQLFRALSEGATPPAAALQVVNDFSAAAPQVARLDWFDGAPHLTMVDVSERDASAVTMLARAAIQLLAGPDQTRIRACGAPGCLLFFLREQRRREWCSAACGNRARVARHYHRHRAPAHREARTVVHR